MLEAEQILHERYQLKEKLGQNAGRQTWRAEDLESQPPVRVIVKLLAFGGDIQWDDLKLFEREAQILKQLNHPQIPKYRDYFSIDERSLWFGLVQEHIPGSSLKELLSQGRKFTEEELRAIASDVLSILIYLHQLNPPVLHRDIKPSNLIWGEDGKIYLVDFGAVQDKAVTEGATFTVVGTYGYAPVEQFGGRTVPASDLYALGASLIHLATGAAPADLPQRDMRIQFSEKVSLSPSFIGWLHDSTEPALERRFSTAVQALEALKTGRSLTYPAQKIRTRTPTLIQISKSARHLNIDIPRRKMSSKPVVWLLVKLLLLVLVMIPPGFLTLVLLSVGNFIGGVGVFQGTLMWALALLPVWIILLKVLGNTIGELGNFRRDRVYFDRKDFRMERLLLSYCYRREKGRTLDIQNVLLQLMEQGFEKDTVTILTGNNRYSFGGWLSDDERVWVVQEINDWLNSGDRPLKN